MILRDYQENTIKEIYKSMAAGNKRPLVCLPCGSGKTVIFCRLAEMTAAKNNTVYILVHRRELYKQTKDTLALFGNNPNVSVHMAQTLSLHLAEYEQPNLIITDECHMAQAATWRRIYENWPESYVIGFSASPCRLDGKPLGEIFDDLILGKTTAELINDKWLAPYEYYSINVADLTGLKQRGSDYDASDAADKLDTLTIYGDVIETFRKRCSDARAVAYCVNIEHSKNTAAAFQKAGYKAVHIDGTISNKKRDKIIEDFRSGAIQIITNCDIVSTGFDLPDITACLMLRPTMSTGLYIQQSGRALRPQKNKTAIILDFVGNYTRHGLPDDDRNWSITEQMGGKRRINEHGEFLIRTCLECYAVYPNTLDVCPICGAPYELTKTEIKNMEEIELERIEKNRILKEKMWALSDEAVDEAKTYSDFCTIAKHRGYKTGWAWHRAKQRGVWTPY